MSLSNVADHVGIVPHYLCQLALTGDGKSGGRLIHIALFSHGLVIFLKVGAGQIAPRALATYVAMDGGNALGKLQRRQLEVTIAYFLLGTLHQVSYRHGSWLLRVLPQGRRCILSSSPPERRNAV